MLDRGKVTASLEEKRPLFQAYTVEAQRQRSLARQQIDTFLGMNRESILEYIAKSGVEWPGALPTRELDQAQKLCLPFAHRWQNHQEARAWARDILLDRPVLAVDGSQLVPTKDHSVPVGAIQIGWYINQHKVGGAYTKDLEFTVLAPQELLGDLPEDVLEAEPEAESGGFPTWRISQIRFILECQKLCELMALPIAHSPISHPSGGDSGETSVNGAGDRLDAAPVCFFDGSFIVSFAGQMRPERGLPYVRAVARLLDCAAEQETPLVAFVDRSYSRDFATLLNLLSATPHALNLSDSSLVAEILPNWGDRTPFFYCARDDGLSREGLASFYPQVVFTYIRLTADRPPARLEMPAWVLETGRAEEVVDVVRAECVVGSGYPYAIETADAVAVIGQQDRRRFYALFEQFLAAEGIPLIQTRKASSKESRR